MATLQTNMTSIIYDVIVVGGGIIGRSTALKLKEKIKKFSMSQSHGSSKGRSKGIQRANWNKDESNAMKKMKDDSILEWERLESDSSGTILTKSKALFIGPAGSAFMSNTKKSLNKYPENEQMQFIELPQEDYPDINFSDNCVAVLDTLELCLGAADILKHILESFKRLGGNTCEGKVQKVTPGNTISIFTDENIEYRTKKLVVATGPWSSSLLHDLGQDIQLTFTKDRKPIIGRHPEKDNICLAVGMSGTGFGYSPAISNIVCDLVFGKEPKYDISEFSVTR